MAAMNAIQRTDMTILSKHCEVEMKKACEGPSFREEVSWLIKLESAASRVSLSL